MAVQSGQSSLYDILWHSRSQARLLNLPTVAASSDTGQLLSWCVTLQILEGVSWLDLEQTCGWHM